MYHINYEQTLRYGISCASALRRIRRFAISSCMALRPAMATASFQAALLSMQCYCSVKKLAFFAGDLRFKCNQASSWQSLLSARPTTCSANSYASARSPSRRSASMTVEGTVTPPDASLEVVRVPMFETNYGWIIRDVASGIVAAVDPAEPLPIQDSLESRCAAAAAHAGRGC